MNTQAVTEERVQHSDRTIDVSGPTVDIHGAAKLMQVHAKTVLDLIGINVLPAAKIGKAYVLLKKDVMAHVEREIVKQTAARMGSTYKRSAPRRRSPQLVGQG